MKRGAFLIQMLAIFGLACVLGAAFNNASPLGLHADEPPPAFLNVPKSLPHAKANPVNSGSNPIAAESNPQIAALIKSLEPPPVPPPATLTWPQAKGILGDGKTVLVDARLPEVFQVGHIPNAVSLPANSDGENIAAFKLKYPPPGTPLIVYCGSDHCHLSEALAKILVGQHGYTNVKTMPSGYSEYLRVEKGTPPTGP